MNGFEGSPLDPKYTFESFVEGKANRIAHAVAAQVAATVLDEQRPFNPLYLHSPVGLGKTHLLHAIAWEVKRRAPKAQVLYLTAERFRYQFVEAVRSQDAIAFKDKFRAIDILLIDDLEFMQGEKTEQEFEHIINALLDGGRQVVVASARPPGQLDRLNDRMRSRMQRGLIVEITRVRRGVAPQDPRSGGCRRSALTDPSFELSEPVLKLLADRLTENGRELEGAVNRLYLTWQLMHTPITPDSVEAIIRDLVLGIEPRRIKVEDILRIVSRHFAVSKAGDPVRPAASLGGAAAADRHVSGQAADVALAARDRPPVRQSRPHHGAARDPQDRQGNGRQSAPQGRDRGAEAAAQPIAARTSIPSTRGLGADAAGRERRRLAPLPAPFV